MNQKTVKTIRRFCRAVFPPEGVDAEMQKMESRWRKTPRNKRAALRSRMLSAIEEAKEMENAVRQSIEQR